MQLHVCYLPCVSSNANSRDSILFIRAASQQTDSQEKHWRLLLFCHDNKQTNKQTMNMMKTRFFTRSQKEEPGGGAGSGGMLTNSERSMVLTDSERSAMDIDIDFDVTESGRTVAHIVSGTALADHDDVDFSITSSGRTIERIMQEQAKSTTTSTTIVPAAKATTSTPLVPAVTATISNPLTIPAPPPAGKSPSRPIPQATQRHDSVDSSGSAFLNGILNSSPNISSSNHHQLSHTPPTAFGTSYENNHFGKRQRSGSVSGRLRSASDLEEKGLIDKNQKGILKDLIICGDEELQQALDQYDAGNPEVLETMIKSGALQNKAVPDLDLLGDLDLDFLTVTDLGEGAVEPEHRDGPGMYSLPAAHKEAPLQQYNPQTSAQSLPAMAQRPPAYGVKRRQASDVTHNRPNAKNMVSPETHDDGIGELEFMGGLSDTEGDADYYAAAAADTAASSVIPQQQQQAPNEKSGKNRHCTFQHLPPPSAANDNRSRSNSTFSFGNAGNRSRANSLFSALINDPKSSNSENHQELGRWMDRVPVNDHSTSAASAALVTTDDGPHTSSTPATRSAVSKPIPIPAAKPEPKLTPNPEPMTTSTQPKKKGRRKSDSAAMDRKLKAKLKQELAEQKRKEKQDKREQREREKQEKREARLAAKEEKKKLKDQKKAAAAAAQAMEEDEKPVHVPGSGRPRSMSDPNFKTSRDEFGLMEIERPEGWVGAYSPESRKVRIEKFLAKRHQRVWTKTVKYDVRKNFADSRLRVKGRFVKKEDEMLMRDLMSMT